MNDHYLGVPIEKIKAGFFELTGCEGCQLQLLNNEHTVLDFLDLLDIRKFREVMTGGTDDYDIAFIEGSVTTKEEVDRLKGIRSRAKSVVALGSCACFGGVNQMINPALDKENTMIDVKPLSAYVDIDLGIPGCPIKKEEVERIVLNLILGKSVALPPYPVCMECKAKENLCLFDIGELCLGPVTKAGCDAWCPENRLGCRGCRGPADDANIKLLLEVAQEKGIERNIVIEALECFGGFNSTVLKMRTT
ncbi:NADH:ubiquinone oxidoreductase [Nitrospirota bacterium]